ncbi:MAG: type II secretion system F family protein [Bacillota bacterium]|jgi:type IV pilus assembly protein PilC
MPEFKFQGRDTQGKPLQGRLQADDQQAALAELTRRGYYISHLEQDRDLRAANLGRRRLSLRPGGRQLGARELGIFARQLGVLYAAGVSILPALAAIREQQGEQSQLGIALAQVIAGVEAGDRLAIAMREPKIFPTILVNMVAAGEVGGTLDETLVQAANYFDREYQLGQKVKNALAYPKFVGGLGVVIVYFLLAFGLPQFTGMFAGSGVELPALTRGLMAVGSFLGRWGWLLLLGAFGLVLAYLRWKATPEGKARLDQLQLRLPLFGRMARMDAISRFCRSLAALLHSGVDVVNSLSLAEQAVDNAVFSQAIRQAIDDVSRGGRLAAALDSGQFPPLVLQMVRVGESSGSLDAMLNQVADFYDRDLDNLAEQLGKLIEPAMILFLAVVVGVIVLAVALPMMQISNIVQF